MGSIWILSASVTALLNLDTTIVLLTPITVRLARRSCRDPLSVAVVPLLLSGLASSFLPVSNLTTLIVQGRTGIDTTDVLCTLGPASAVAVVVGWLMYRRGGVPPLQILGPGSVHAGSVPAGPTEAGPVESNATQAGPTESSATESGATDRRALIVGGTVIASTVAGFVVGSSIGVAPWVVLLVADAALAGLLKWFPWRQVPFATAGAIGATVALVSWAGIGAAKWTSSMGSDRP